MPRKITPLAVLLTVAAGCSGQAELAGTATPVSPTSAPSAPTTTPVEPTSSICAALDAELFNHLITEAMTVGGDKQGAELRSSVAMNHVRFADRLHDIAQRATGDLRLVVAEWADASTEVGNYVATTEPAPGLVIDYGPAHPRSLAAEKAAEKICGHPLPKDD